MGTRIDSLSILLSLQNTTTALNASALRLSTGKRINTAADDPSGLVISNELQSQIDSYDTAIGNAQSATNLLKTANGAYSQITSLLNTINTNILQAQNNLTLFPSAVAANEASIQSAIAAINNIAGSTSYGGKNLLDGSAGTSAAVTNGSLVAGITLSGQAGAGALIQSGAITLTVIQAATEAQATGGATYASVNATLATVNGGTAGNGGSVNINGQSISVAGSDTVQTLIGKINAISNNTGVAAAAVSGNGSVAIQLTQTTYGSNYKINASESSPLIFGSTGTSVAGINAVAAFQTQASVNGNVYTNYGTVTAGLNGASGLQFNDFFGNSVLLTQAGNSLTTVNQKIGQVTSSPISFQIGIGSTNSSASLSLPSFTSSALGSSVIAGQNVSTIDVTTAAGAANALQIVSQALSQVNTAAATVGSFQNNVLGSSINVMQSAVTNLTASVSQIVDVDPTKETLNYNRLQQQQTTAATLLQYTFSQQSNLYRLLGI